MTNRNNGRPPTILLISDPNDFYSSQATFTSYEFAYSTLIGSWLDGMHFLIQPQGGEPFEAMVVGGVPVSLMDGRHLWVRHSGSYGWREGAFEWTNTKEVESYRQQVYT